MVLSPPESPARLEAYDLRSLQRADGQAFKPKPNLTTCIALLSVLGLQKPRDHKGRTGGFQRLSIVPNVFPDRNPCPLISWEMLNVALMFSKLMGTCFVCPYGKQGCFALWYWPRFAGIPKSCNFQNFQLGKYLATRNPKSTNI